ncbi:hypothetical protein ACFL1S_07090, partial [Pseudomonadota bacterium]
VEIPDNLLGTEFILISVDHHRYPSQVNDESKPSLYTISLFCPTSPDGVYSSFTLSFGVKIIIKMQHHADIGERPCDIANTPRRPFPEGQFRWWRYRALVES